MLTAAHPHTALTNTKAHNCRVSNKKMYEPLRRWSEKKAAKYMKEFLSIKC